MAIRSEPARARIEALKQERNAIILAHNYTRPEVQQAADFVGDSLGLARAAAKTDAAVIVFCGVWFMGETAAILCPGKQVLMPDPNAGCPMANMASPRELEAMKAQHPDAVVVAYVNSSAAVKALSDVCCTSANAVDIVAAIDREQPVLFVPDRNLGHYVSRRLEREILLWPGYCPTHQRILPEHVLAAKRAHPEALFVAHPECRPAVLELADGVASTTGILRYCAEHDAPSFIIGTENELLYRLEQEHPGKAFYPASPVADCPNMKLPTLDKIIWCLEDLSGRVCVDREVAERARRPIERMLAAGQAAAPR